MAFDSTRDQALSSVRQIYADVGHAITQEDIDDLDNRIRNGQTIAELVANTYDQAQRRFRVPDTPATRAQEAAGQLPTYDSQLNQGRTFDPPAVMLEQLAVPAREQAPMMSASPLARIQQPSLSLTRSNAGPASMATAGGGLLPAGGSAWPMLLLLGGGALVLFVLLRRGR